MKRQPKTVHVRAMINARRPLLSIFQCSRHLYLYLVSSLASCDLHSEYLSVSIAVAHYIYFHNSYPSYPYLPIDVRPEPASSWLARRRPAAPAWWAIWHFILSVDRRLLTAATAIELTARSSSTAFEFVCAISPISALAATHLPVKAGRGRGNASTRCLTQGPTAARVH